MTMIVIERFSKKYSNIFTENEILLQDRKLSPPKIIKYALEYKELVLVAIENKFPIGFIIGVSNQTQRRNSILTIFVKENSRNKKIGTLLINTLITQNQFKQVPYWTIRLRTIDYPIIGFFEHCGFSIVTELNLYKKLNTEFIVNHNQILSDIFNIEVAQKKHTTQLMRLEKQCFDNFWFRTKEEWLSIIENDNSVVYILIDENLQEEENIVGFSHNSISKSNGYKEGQYIRIAINPAYRRAGLATKLTEKAFEYFKRNDTKRIYLSTVKENSQLNEMYQKWGFELYDSDTILGRKIESKH